MSAAMPQPNPHGESFEHDFDFATNQRHEYIAVAAYFRAEKRGFAAGHDLDDWLQAEQEMDKAVTPLPSY